MSETIDSIANKVSSIAQLLECDVLPSDRQFVHIFLICKHLG